MSRPGRDGGSGSRRRSFFSRPPLSALTPIGDGSSSTTEATGLLKKKRTASLFSNSSTQAGDNESIGFEGESPASPVRPPFPSRSRRPSSLFGSLRSIRSTDDQEEPLSATSSKAPSVHYPDLVENLKARSVLRHGEVQTSGSMFRKKKEYLVLTESHIVRFKSQQKAAETFSSIPPPIGRSGTLRHSQTPSAGSSHDLSSIPSEASGDREMGTPLRQVVAVYHIDDGRPYFAIEVAYLDDDTNQASSMTLQFGEPEDMNLWLAAIRKAADLTRLNDAEPISAYSTHLAARVVEREKDYEPPNFAIYKVVQRPFGKAGSRASSDDLSKAASAVCFLVIGVHKVHLIPLFKPQQRASSPALVAHNTQASFGILTLSSLRVSEKDDTFELTFRLPLQKPKTLYLASLASHDIAVRLRYVDELLRPEWESRPCTYSVPDDVKQDILRNSSPHPMDENSLQRTLTAYCIAYDVEPRDIVYAIEYPPEDFPRFELKRPDRRRPEYTVHELLAIMRSLRYNESFGGISFRGVNLDVLNGLNDPFGTEHVCSKTKRGTPVRMDIEELGRSCLLVQEIRALAITSKKLRRMDFTSCIRRKPRDYMDASNSRDMGCGIVEALFPLCKYQTTNVDWIILNNIQLGETDLDYLVGAAAEKACHFRALEMSGCGLTDRGISLILDALRPQENTLEALDLSSNLFRLSPSTFDLQIGVFPFIRKLNLSHIARTSGPEPLISSETLQVWRLQELILSGTPLNSATVEALASYLRNFKQSKGLRTLSLDHTYLTGKDIAYLLHSMAPEPGTARELVLDVSQNNIEKDLDQVTTAIASGYGPRSIILRMMEFEQESAFRQLVHAFAVNKTIASLDISRASLPCDAQEETVYALERMFAENKTLLCLDLSGEDSRLETSKLGVGINKALCGLKKNNTLQILRIQYQKLGLQGASTLADVLKINHTLREVHCENNDIPLSGFTDLVNSLHQNTTVTYLPDMSESRQLAIKQTEDQIKQMRDDGPPSPNSRTSTVRNKIASRVGISGPKERAAPVHFSAQDINAAIALVDESWSRQVYRLQQYLQRNNNIALGIPTNMEVDEEEFERPDTAVSITGILQKVKTESTPTLEKQLQLGDTHKVSDDPSEAVIALANALDASLGFDTTSLEHRTF